jgi:hypothetical protein
MQLLALLCIYTSKGLGRHSFSVFSLFIIFLQRLNSFPSLWRCTHAGRQVDTPVKGTGRYYEKQFIHGTVARRKCFAKHFIFYIGPTSIDEKSSYVCRRLEGIK